MAHSLILYQYTKFMIKFPFFSFFCHFMGIQHGHQEEWQVDPWRSWHRDQKMPTTSLKDSKNVTFMYNWGVHRPLVHTRLNDTLWLIQSYSYLRNSCLKHQSFHRFRIAAHDRHNHDPDIRPRVVLGDMDHNLDAVLIIGRQRRCGTWENRDSAIVFRIWWSFNLC